MTTASLTQGIFVAGNDAVGLASLRKGFGRTPVDDRLFALGWPHLVYLVEGDATAAELADAKKFSAAYPFEEGEVPAGVAPRMLRHLQTYSGPPKKWLANIQNAAPLSDKEAERMAKDVIVEHMGTVAVYLLEALRSSAWVLDRVIAAYEAAVPKWQKVDTLEAFGDGALRALHFVLLRVTKAEADSARKRLAAIAKALAKAKVPEWNRAYAWLRIVLAPKKAPAKIYNLSLRSPAEAKLVRERALKYLGKMEKGDTADPDARLAFLGGNDVTKAYAKHAGELSADQRKALVVQFARAAHPSVATLMKTVNDGRAKKWLRAHG